MTPERWQQIKAVLNDALSLPASDRSAFVARVCVEDTSLRREVESFLALGESQLRTSLSETACQHIPILPVASLGGYQVQSLLGVGGMGEVYRAHDPRLLRDVAIKVLPLASTQDPDRLRRFEQEARAAAALNHPNILAIYDFGTTAEGIPYVVSELLEGETLREVLRRGPLPVRKTVELAIQICSGLAAAHERDIIHRDLKPENLFVTRDGRAKILDFGLAKLVRNSSPSSSDSSTLPRETAAGVVMGTIGYMPPEQVRGSQVDHRSDIFALGAILYEMLSGNRAFSGDTPADTIAAILGRDPVPLSVANPSVPLVFDRIVRRCLEKSANERFHSVRDVAFALEAISDSIPVSTGIPARTSSQLLRMKVWLTGFAILLLGFGGGLLVYRYRTQPPASQEWEPLTSFSDSVTAPALSPDGHLLAFVRNSNPFVGAGELYVKLLPRGEPVQLTHDNEMKTNPAFSLDGSRIAYTVAPAWDTRVVPTLGGAAQLLLPNASGLSWIDDRHILFSEKKAGVHMAVVTATESRAEQRDVYVPAGQDGMAHRSSISPDHKWVLIASEMGPDGNMACRLMPFAGEPPGSIVGPPGPCSYAAWSPDGEWMYFSATVGKGYHLWRQRFPDGTPAQMTYGPTEEEGVAPTPDGRFLLTSVGQTSGNVVVLEHGNQLSLPFEGFARLMPPQFSTRSIFSPDGSWIYFLGAHSYTDPEELWRQNLKTGVAERALPGISIASSYDISRDGGQVVFDSFDAEGQSHLWIAPVDHHQPPQRLESRTPGIAPLFGPDGGIYFLNQVQGKAYLSRYNPATGETQQLFPQPIIRLHTISPDGKWIVAEAAVSGDKATRSVYAYNVMDGTSKRLCYDLCSFLWTLDGKQVYVSVFSPGGPSGDYKTFVIPLRRGQDFPDLPANGIQSEHDLDHLSRARIIPEFAYPGPDDSRYALSRSTVHRNIFRIPIP